MGYFSQPIPQAAVVPPAIVLQSVYAEYLANVNLATVLPVDDTIPQQTEGNEILTATLTPANANNRIRVRFKGMISATGNTNCAAALFKNAIAAALTATAETMNVGNDTVMVALEYQEIAGDILERTYKIRVGANAGLVRMHGHTVARYFGGIARSTLIVEELSA